MTVPPRMQPLGPSTGVLGGWRAVRRPTPRRRSTAEAAPCRRATLGAARDGSRRLGAARDGSAISRELQRNTWDSNELRRNFPDYDRDYSDYMYLAYLVTLDLIPPKLSPT